MVPETRPDDTFPFKLLLRVSGDVGHVPAGPAHSRSVQHGHFTRERANLASRGMADFEANNSSVGRTSDSARLTESQTGDRLA